MTATTDVRTERLRERIKYKKPFVEICFHTTRDKCPSGTACEKVHFRPYLQPHTEVELGDCSYLNSCHRMPQCRYIHWALEHPKYVPASAKTTRVSGSETDAAPEAEATPESKTEPDTGEAPKSSEAHGGAETEFTVSVAESTTASTLPPQYLNVDLRSFDVSVLGQFDVVVADPPWAIHQELPYGTMTDEEMLRMPVGSMQAPGGLLFLWVTGRAMELGRDCLIAWGYERIDELIWVKTNQLQRLIRTGRTGHWLNHSKELNIQQLYTQFTHKNRHCIYNTHFTTFPFSELSPRLTPLQHCIVAVRKQDKDSEDFAKPVDLPPWLAKGLDTQVILSEVRETSRKPDELYDLIERATMDKKDARKVELFGRLNNLRPGWITLGNQLKNKANIYEPDVIQRYNARYPHSPIKLSGTDE